MTEERQSSKGRGQEKVRCAVAGELPREASCRNRQLPCVCCRHGKCEAAQQRARARKLAAQDSVGPRCQPAVSALSKKNQSPAVAVTDCFCKCKYGGFIVIKTHVFIILKCKHYRQIQIYSKFDLKCICPFCRWSLPSLYGTLNQAGMDCHLQCCYVWSIIS